MTNRIATCPSSDLDQLSNLEKIRKSLVGDSLAPTLFSEAADENKFGLGDIAEAAVIEGACALLLEFRAP